MTSSYFTQKPAKNYLQKKEKQRNPSLFEATVIQLSISAAIHVRRMIPSPIVLTREIPD